MFFVATKQYGGYQRVPLTLLFVGPASVKWVTQTDNALLARAAHNNTKTQKFYGRGENRSSAPMVPLLLLTINARI
jgi:hypothetical protein